MNRAAQPTSDTDQSMNRTSRLMNRTAKKLLTYGVAGVVLGTLLAAYGVDIFVWLSNLEGSNAEAGLAAVSIVITLLRGVIVPMGDALFGASLVINVVTQDVRLQITLNTNGRYYE